MCARRTCVALKMIYCSRFVDFRGDERTQTELRAHYMRWHVLCDIQNDFIGKFGRMRGIVRQHRNRARINEKTETQMELMS